MNTIYFKKYDMNQIGKQQTKINFYYFNLK